MLGAAPDHHVTDIAVVNVLAQGAHAHIQQLRRFVRRHQLFGVHIGAHGLAVNHRLTPCKTSGGIGLVS
jgi:hypothetical protein